MGTKQKIRVTTEKESKTFNQDSLDYINFKMYVGDNTLKLKKGSQITITKEE